MHISFEVDVQNYLLAALRKELPQLNARVEAANLVVNILWRMQLATKAWHLDPTFIIREGLTK